MVHALTQKGGVGSEIRRRMRGERLSAPTLIDSEVAHNIFRMAKGGGGRTPELSPEGLTLAMDVYRSFRVQRVDVLPLWPRMRELSSNLSGYDATYVALAEAFDVPLITSDARIDRSGVARCRIEVFN